MRLRVEHSSHMCTFLTQILKKFMSTITIVVLNNTNTVHFRSVVGLSGPAATTSTTICVDQFTGRPMAVLPYSSPSILQATLPRDKLAPTCIRLTYRDNLSALSGRLHRRVQCKTKLHPCPKPFGNRIVRTGISWNASLRNETSSRPQQYSKACHPDQTCIANKNSFVDLASINCYVPKLVRNPPTSCVWWCWFHR